MMRLTPRLRLFSWSTACFGGLACAIAACGARTGLEAEERAPVPEACGDGSIQDGEECDLGEANEDRPAILLINQQLSTPVTPLLRKATAGAFYDYSSESSHTGFEALHASRLFLYQEAAAPGLSLFTFHGIDLDSTGQDEGDGAVQQTISGLPSGVSIVLGDEPNELSLQPGGTAICDWSYHHNTDGAVLGGVPFPGSWQIVVDSHFIASLTRWDYVDGDGTTISLSLPTAILQAFNEPSACRTDCTVPRCGDGRLDGGEVCDDGDTAPGDGCAGDCKSTD